MPRYLLRACVEDYFHKDTIIPHVAMICYITFASILWNNGLWNNGEDFNKDYYTIAIISQSALKLHFVGNINHEQTHILNFAAVTSCEQKQKNTLN